jgi:RNA polymerase subunit RPABC4/transcription elongation factor Spt4
MNAIGTCPTCERTNTTPNEWFAILALVAAVVTEVEESRGEMFRNLNVARAAMGRINREVESYLRARSL